MKRTVIIAICSLVSFVSMSQTADIVKPKNKWRVYTYWGWNHSYYTKSDIHFKGNGHDFTLYDVIAEDRQTQFNWSTYFNPKKLSIPQYNFRVGVFYKEKYNISFGFDHMKYVVQPFREVRIDGYIHNTGTKYDKEYHNELIVLNKDFLQLEHTNGLNYLNIEINRLEMLWSYRKLIALNATGGVGTGIMLPRTDCTLINYNRHDVFHWAGMGFSAKAGLNLTFWEHFFVQAELKSGFVTMPSVRTTDFKTDKASQRFWFFAPIGVFGYTFSTVK